MSKTTGDSSLGTQPRSDLQLAVAAAAALAEAGSVGKGCTTVTATGVRWQTIIHSVSILSAPGLAWTDRLMGQGLKTAAQH